MKKRGERMCISDEIDEEKMKTEKGEEKNHTLSLCGMSSLEAGVAIRCALQIRCIFRFLYPPPPLRHHFIL